MIFKFWKQFITPIRFNFDDSDDTAQTNQTQNAEPWSQQIPYLGYGFDQAQANYQDPASYYPNQGFVPFSDQTTDALGQMQGIAQENKVGNAAANESYNTLTGQYLNNNPYVDQMADRVGGDVMAGVNSTFNQGGRFGSNAHADTFANSIADASAAMRYQNYDSERQNMIRASALAPQSAQMQYAGANQLAGVGSAIEGKQYEALQDDMNRFNFYENQPNRELGNYMAAIGGNYGGTTDSTSIAPTFGGSPAMGALGGGLAGFSLGNEFGYGKAGAALGGLAGLFS